MTKVRAFIEEIDLHALPEFGGFSAKAESESVVSVQKCINGHVLKRRVIFSFEEVDVDLADIPDMAAAVMRKMDTDFYRMVT